MSTPPSRAISGTELRYGGGQANQLYIFDIETHDAKKISEGDRASRDPMWIGNSIYYDSDKDGHFNLYAYDVQSGKTTELTSNKTFDLRWPSTDRESRIVYELNGELQILDVKTRKNTPISINVPSDELARRPSRVSAGDQSSNRSSVRRASERCLRRAAIFLPCRLKKDRCGI